MTRFSRSLITVAAALVSTSARAQSRSPSIVPFKKFWAAESPIEAGRIAEEIAKTSITFEDALHRLKQGELTQLKKRVSSSCRIAPRTGWSTIIQSMFHPITILHGAIRFASSFTGASARGRQ